MFSTLYRLASSGGRGVGERDDGQARAALGPGQHPQADRDDQESEGAPDPDVPDGAHTRNSPGTARLSGGRTTASTVSTTPVIR